MSCTQYTSGGGRSIQLAGALPLSFCHTTWQSTFDAFLSAIAATMPGNFAGLVVGDSTPAAEDRDKLWFRTKASCEPLGLFVFYNGTWKRAIPHHLPPGTIIDFYSTSLPGSNHAINAAYLSFLDAYDATYPGGGSTTICSNPFWLVCNGTLSTPDLMGRVTVGAGLGSGLSDRQSGTSGGEESHQLSLAELPNLQVQSGAAYGSGSGFASSTTNGNVLDVVKGGGGAHNNLQPFYCVYKLIRTSRTI
jgi:hypothetical protein